MTLWDMAIYSYILHWLDISQNLRIVIELDNITGFNLITKFREVSIEYMQRVRLADRGQLLLQTPGPVRFWTFSNGETLLSWTCHFSWFCFSNIPQYFLFAYLPIWSVLSKQTGSSPSSRQHLIAVIPLAPAPMIATLRALPIEYIFAYYLCCILFIVNEVFMYLIDK